MNADHAAPAPLSLITGDEALKAAYVAFFKAYRGDRNPVEAMRAALVAASERAEELLRVEGSGPPPDPEEGTAE